MWFADILQRNAIRFPSAVALRDPWRAVTWRELQDEVAHLASALAQKVPPGGRVVLFSGGRLEMLEAYLACAAAGVVVAPVNPALTAPEVASIVASLEPSLLLADAAGRKRFADEHPDLATMAIEDVAALPPGPPPPSGADSLTAPFAILHTSATTGRPKGVVVDQRSIQIQALSYLGEVDCGPETVFLDACPLFHGSVVFPFSYLAQGATVCVLDGFTPRSCLNAVRDWEVNHLFAVPSMVALMLQTGEVAPNADLTLLVHAAAPMSAELAQQAEKAFGTDLLTIYGITEGGGMTLARRVTDEPAAPPIAGATCIGLPMLGTGARIMAEDGTPAGPGEIGELWLRGDGLMHGYWQNPGATAESMPGGWLNTKDLSCVDSEGYFWVVDRRNDLILRGGQNVYPAEIEAALRLSPNVIDVAVVPAPSPVWGQTPVAFVQAHLFDEVELLKLCVSQLASYKRPSRFVAVERIPRSAAGKILRPQLRAQAQQLMDGTGE
jgi:acyl-CoA synthetase (AMP-forming)/AMP-acid ligase II